MTTHCPHCNAPLPQSPLPPRAPYTARAGNYGPAQRLPQSMQHAPRLPPKSAQVRFQCPACNTWLRWQANGQTRQMKAPPLCPSCGSEIEAVRRVNKRTGQAFWACPNYPRCKAKMPQVPRTVRAADFALVVAGEQREPRRVDSDGNLVADGSGGRIVLNETREKMLVEIERREKFYKKRGERWKQT